MRHAWVMKLKPGQEAEYKRKHDEIWPEMVEVLKRQGIRNYSIYRHGLTLFAYYEKDDGAPPDPGGPPDPVIQRWWASMAPHMETVPLYNAPVTEPVELVFRLD